MLADNRFITRRWHISWYRDVVSAPVQRPRWPADQGHRDAIDTLLVMAEAEDRWGERHRALDLLANVEQIVGTLPPDYERLRRRCSRDGRRSLRSPTT
jgi:hypothetical protein